MSEFEFLGITPDNPIHLNIDPASTDALCHYTDINGLKGILSGNCFWVTRSDYLNDSSEIIQIKNVIELVYNQFTEDKHMYCNEYDTNGLLMWNFMDYIKFIGNKIDNNQSTRDYDIYVLSLSENSDSLALFSNYSTLDGYCLGFDTDRLLNFESPPRYFSRYKDLMVSGGKVIYSLSEQVQTLWNDILKAYNSVFERLRYNKVHVVDQSIYNIIFKELMSFIAVKIQIYAIFFKHPSFYHEEEYRVAFIIDDEHSNILKFRTKGSERIPYIEYEFNKLPLKFIRKSPKNNSDIKDLVDRLNYNDVEILESEIPLR